MREAARNLLVLRAALSLLALVAVVLLAFSLLSDGELGRAEAWANLAAPERNAGALIVILAVAASIIVRGLRWVALMGEAAPVPPGRMVAAFGWSFLVLQALPFRAGESYRVVWVKLRGESALRTITTIVVERGLDALLLVAVLAVAVLAHPALGGVFSWLAAVVSAAAGLGLLAAILAARRLRLLAGRSLGRGRTGTLIDTALDGLSAVGEPRRGLAVALLSLAAWGLLGVAFSIFLGGWHDLPWQIGFAVLALTNLASFVTVAPGNLGVFEAVGVAILAGAGIPADAALVAIVALHLAVLLGQLATGLACRIALAVSERR